MVSLLSIRWCCLLPLIPKDVDDVRPRRYLSPFHRDDRTDHQSSSIVSGIPPKEPRYLTLASHDLLAVPPLVRIALTDRYEFIAVEKEIVADLIDSFRTCNTCKKWASSQESVRCE